MTSFPPSSCRFRGQKNVEYKEFFYINKDREKGKEKFKLSSSNSWWMSPEFPSFYFKMAIFSTLMLILRSKTFLNLNTFLGNVLRDEPSFTHFWWLMNPNTRTKEKYARLLHHKTLCHWEYLSHVDFKVQKTFWT